MDIHIQKDGRQLGPFPESRIRGGIDAGEFAPTDLAWTKGKASWQPLSSLIDLDVTKPPPPTASFNTLSPPLSNTVPLTNSEGLFSAPSSKQAETPVPLLEALPPPTGLFRKRISPNHHQETLASRIYKGIAYALVATTVIGFGGMILWQYQQMPKKNGTDFDYISKLKQYQPTPSHWKYDDPLTQSNGADRIHRASVSPSMPYANLWGEESEFVKVYGKPVRKSHDPRSPETDDLTFVTSDGLNYLVSFWEGRAHRIMVSRTDLKALTDDQIQEGLKSFAGGGEWNHQFLSGVLGRDRWERTGAIAWMVPPQKDLGDQGANIPETRLTMETNEYTAAWKEANEVSR